MNKLTTAHRGSEYRPSKNQNNFLVKIFFRTPSPALSPYDFLVGDTPALFCSHIYFSFKVVL